MAVYDLIKVDKAEVKFDKYVILLEVKYGYTQQKTREELDRRLPTEAEWKKAARGENASIYPWGSDPPNSDLLDFNQIVGDTTEVGKFPAGASPFETFDMASNAMEWVADWDDSCYYSNSDLSDPPGPTSGDTRVVRDGSWNNRGFSARSADRSGLDPGVSLNYVGFRCARMP